MLLNLAKNFIDSRIGIGAVVRAKRFEKKEIIIVYQLDMHLQL